MLDPVSIAIVSKNVGNINQSDLLPDPDLCECSMMKATSDLVKQLGGNPRTVNIVSQHAFESKSYLDSIALQDCDYLTQSEFDRNNPPNFDGTRPLAFEISRSSDATVALPSGLTKYQMEGLMKMSRQRILLLDQQSVQESNSGRWEKVLPLASLIVITFDSAKLLTEKSDPHDVGGELVRLSRGRPVFVIGGNKPMASNHESLFQHSLSPNHQLDRTELARIGAVVAMRLAQQNGVVQAVRSATQWFEHRPQADSQNQQEWDGLPSLNIPEVDGMVFQPQTYLQTNLLE